MAVTKIKKGSGDQILYTLEIPLDASAIEDFKPEQGVKVVVQTQQGQLEAQTARLSEKGRGQVKFLFRESPGIVNVSVGPENASNEEILGLQTLNFKVSSRQWKNDNELTLSPVVISSYYWFWWLRWCRTFTIRGRVICPDGSPVPGATVCAYDVDRWFVWSSKQQVGCATTDVSGSFSISFRWCCGWWPWWWWRNRLWHLDPDLIAQIRPVLQRVPDLPLAQVTNLPSLKVFEPLLGTGGLRAQKQLTAADVSRLPQLRDQLLTELPAASELAQLKIWPWWPWNPWWDCTPDIVFKVTQDCGEGEKVIIDESVSHTRWNISNPLQVTLVSENEACCRPGHCPNPPCEEGECVTIDEVCHFPIDEIGGNLGADPVPAGYASPGAVPSGSWDYHRPFGGIVPIYKNPGDLIAVDYYELEVDDGISGWKPLESAYPGAGRGFKRKYWASATATFHNVDFPLTVITGHAVIETREHYEAGSGLSWDIPGADAWWMSPNWNMLIPLDSHQIVDGTYRFRVVGWDLDSSGILVNRRVLPICGGKDDNSLVLTIDNRVIDAITHNPTHNCGAGVHLCTVEPDTHILDVRINGVSVDPCDTVDATTGSLEIDFQVSDVDGHLGFYELRATWGLNNAVNLLNRPGASVTSGGAASGWAPGHSRGNYGTALMQGAVAPHWNGGIFTLTVPVNEAFPEPCCYQLELEAYKRTVIGAQTGITYVCTQTHRNLTRYAIGVGVCGADLNLPVLTADSTVAVNTGSN